MKNYKQLEKEFEANIKILQNSCNHKSSKTIGKYPVKRYSGKQEFRKCSFCNKLFMKGEK
jgi:hypothetical protein